MMKKVPLRKCIGCQEMKSKKGMLRIVKTNENEIFVDKTGKANGRGCYVCSIDCALKVVKKKSLDKVFGAKISSDLYDKLEESLSNNE